LRGPVESAQYTSVDYTHALDDHLVLGSIGTVGDALDNALAESFVDSYKTELISDRVWRSQAQLELATVDWVAWFNHDRLHSSLGDIPPVEFEQHAAVAALTVNAQGAVDGSLQAICQTPAHEPRTSRPSTIGLESVLEGSMSTENASVRGSGGSAQAATTVVKRRELECGLSAVRSGFTHTHRTIKTNNQNTVRPT
jgi:putative transposase